MLRGVTEPRIFTPPLRKLTPKTSLGFEVTEFGTDVLGVEWMPWQKWLNVHALELREDGRPRFRTVLVLIARQNGKTTWAQVRSLWRMFVDEAALVIGTAQDLETAEDVWTGAVEMAESVPELAAEIAAVDRTNGKKALRLTGGQRYVVKAASRKAGRGKSGDEVLLDELREHRDWEAWGALTKTTMARPDALILCLSNAGDGSSVVLNHLRTIAMEKMNDPTTDIGIFEWSAPDDCDLDDKSGWAQANPALGYTIEERTVVSARTTDPEDVFRTEVLCQWVDNSGADDVLSPADWTAAESDAAPSGELSLAVDVGPNQVWSSIVACGNGVIEVIDRRRGASWLTERMVELAARHPIAEFGLDPAGPVGALLPEFERETLPVRLLDGKDTVRACGALIAGITDKTLSHRGEPELLAAIGGASRRAVGDGWKWSRKDSTVDISPLVAATYAHWLWLSREGQPISPDIYFV